MHSYMRGSWNWLSCWCGSCTAAPTRIYDTQFQDALSCIVAANATVPVRGLRREGLEANEAMNIGGRFLSHRLAFFAACICVWSAVGPGGASAQTEDSPTAAQGKSDDAKAKAPEKNQAGDARDCPDFRVNENGTVPFAATRASDKISIIDPPEQGFFSKVLDYDGIPIKAHKDVADEALYAARNRLSTMMANLPDARRRLHVAGAELHIIGRNQVTTDLPEWREDKGVPLEEYNGLTRDERTRGMGGLLASCGEENLLKLEKDRYKGRDICVHEFAHDIFDFGIPREVRAKFREQYAKSLKQGLWKGAYAASNPDEYFAELSMWYFGTHGDLHMKGDKPENGPDGLKKYDPDAFALFDELYSGRMTSHKSGGKDAD